MALNAAATTAAAALGACLPSSALRPHLLRRSIPPVGVHPARRRNLKLLARAKAPMACSADGALGLLEAAKLAVDKYVKNGMVVGLGTGRASALAIQHLGRQLREGALKDIVGIPMSVFSASEAAKAGIPLDNYQDSLQIDFAFDDADIIEEETLRAIVGRRRLDVGESILQEKSIVKKAGKLAFIISENQYTKDLDGSVPVLVNGGNWMETAEVIDDLFLGDAEVWRRPTSGHADPLGGDFPLVTKEGHFVLDVIFTSPIVDLGQVAESLNKIDGVVDHGIICGIPCTVVIASKNGVDIADNLLKDPVIDSL